MQQVYYLGVKLIRSIWFQLVDWGVLNFISPNSGATRNTPGSALSDSAHMGKTQKCKIQLQQALYHNHYIINIILSNLITARQKGKV